MERRWIAIALLLACSVAVQCTIVYRAATPALDSLRSVAAAEALLKSPRWKTLAEEPEPPLFPVWLAMVHATRGAAGPWLGHASTDWATSLQLAAALPLALWPAVVYWIARRRFGDRAALLAGLLACLLPAAARLGGEGLSDALHLLWFSVAVACLTRRTNTLAANAVGGGVLALAMLVRVEAALLFIAVGLAELLDSRRRLGDRWLACCRRLAPAGGGLALTLLPALWGMACFTPGDAIARLTSRGPARDGWVFNAPRLELPSDRNAFSGDGYTFDSKERGASTRRYGSLAAAFETADELLVATGFALAPLALVTAFRVPRWRLWDRVAICGVALWVGMAYVNAAATGYLSGRHLLPVAVFLLPAAARALAAKKSSLRALTLPAPSLVLVRGLAVAVLLAWGVWGSRPLHGDRAGHRDAGVWLAEHAGAADRVLDTWGWSALVSSRATYRYDAAREAFADPRLRYVVVERRELESGTPRAATLGRLLAQHGTCAIEFASSGAQSPVLIFHWRPPLAQNEARKTGWLGSNVLIRPQRAGPGGE